VRILIADNEPGYYDGLRSALDVNRPHQDEIVLVNEAIAAYDALVQTKDRPFDLIILDECMGGGEHNGSALLRRLHDQPPYDPAIIYITGHYDEMPSDQITQSGARVTLFLDKHPKSDELLYRAVLLVARQREEPRYHPIDSFGTCFTNMLAAEVEEAMQTPCAGYDDMSGQRTVASFIRSFLTTVRMRSYWTSDDVLELSVLLAESLARFYELPPHMISLVRRFYAMDEILYTIPRYRDHFLHQIKVFLLGYCILNALNRSRRLEGTTLGQKNSMKLWFLASVFHDVGYPFEYMRDWLNGFVLGVLKSPDEKEAITSLVPMEFNWGVLFARRYNWYHLERIADTLCRCYKPGDNTVRTNLLVALAEHLAESPDHGLFSSLILQNFLRVNLGDEEVDPVVVAVALHNWVIATAVREAICTELSFRKDPLSFLLMFCDTAQEWGRAEAAMRELKPSTFGEATFDGLSWNQDSGEMKLDILFARKWGARERDAWRQGTFNKELRSLRGLWTVDVTAPQPLSFSITYSHGESQQDRQILDVLHF
jgi:DNA-binding NarL/FixJ family response regulator